MAKGNYIAEIEHRIAGIPCLIGVIGYDCVEGSYNYFADSDVDYYGYTESEWDVLDRKGYRAKWLERKLDDDENSEVEAAIARHFK